MPERAYFAHASPTRDSLHYSDVSHQREFTIATHLPPQKVDISPISLYPSSERAYISHTFPSRELIIVTHLHMRELSIFWSTVEINYRICGNISHFCKVEFRKLTLYLLSQ
jgi:hypothetical protein